jgi:predicted aldo/keto reductase-like oxidoreductase
VTTLIEPRALGQTGLLTSGLGFGGIKLPQVEAETASRALNRALDLGINFVDTARRYKDSEEKIGHALHRRREEVILASKTPCREAQSALEDLEASLRSLRTDAIDLYQLHSVSSRPDYERVMGPGGALEGLKRAQRQGKVRHIGISCHRALDVMKDAIASGEFETIMVAYSPLDPEAVAAEVMPMAREREMGVIVMKPLSGGRLVSAPGPEREGVVLDPVVAGSLRWVLSHPAVTVAIPGMTSVGEVEQNAAAIGLGLPLSEQDRRDLVAAVGGLRREFRYGQACLRCGYCQPCPQGIRAPEVFRAYDMLKEYPDHLKWMARELYASLDVTPEACVECRQCVEKCPAGLDVPERLKEAAAAFAAEPTPS